jgi:phosphate transport system substrate-binding protein
MLIRKTFSLVTLLVITGLLLGACSPAAPTSAAAETTSTPVQASVMASPTSSAEPQEGAGLADLNGDVVIDGSSTVYPITAAVAEEFAKVAPDVRISVGLSGTGGGFKKFCPGEIDISDASRPIKEEEISLCKENAIEYVAYMIALDGLTVMVNPENDWLQSLSVDQLAQLLGASSSIKKWSDLDPSYPDEDILFFVPDPDSGTRDYMIEIVKGVNGDEDLRQDENTTFSSDDNVLLDGIAHETYGIGFFGYAYYVENQDIVRAVAIVNEAGEAVLPSDATVQDGSYNPLSRPLYIYVNTASLLEKPQVAGFVEFFFGAGGGPKVISDVGYSLPPSGTYESNLEQLTSLLQ